MAIEPGTSLGPYVIIEFLASGGMGEVYRARDPRLKRDVAIKVLATLHESVAPLEPRARCPPALERLILHCLEKDPGARFETARDLAFGLESLLGDLRHPATVKAEAGSTPEASSIAVLPFADMSPARDQDYLCEGLAEELILALTQIEGLRVAARSSSFQFKASGVDVRAVGARLGVTTVLEGGVRKVGDRLRVSVQLVDVADGYHRWSQRYDRELEDVFAIQDEIAESVATALRGILSPREKEALHRPEAAVESYEYFLRGCQLLHRSRRAPLESAARMFQRAIDLDPRHAAAYAGLADVHCWFYEWMGGGEAALAAAEHASGKALELAPKLAQAHSSRGFVLSLANRYAEAETEFREAIRLNPNLFETYYLWARTCFASGKIERAADLFRRAGELGAEDFQSMALLAQSLSVLRRADEAREANLEAVRPVERHLELNPTGGRALSLGANALFSLGEHDRAMAWCGRALELYPDDQGILINAACIHARAGRKEQALELLEWTFAKGSGKRDWIEHDPDYDSLRDDPRFQALIENLR